MAAPQAHGPPVTRFLPRRTTIDVVAIVLCATLIVLRTRTLFNQPGGFRYSIGERFSWPEGVGRKENCFRET